MSNCFILSNGCKLYGQLKPGYSGPVEYHSDLRYDGHIHNEYFDDDGSSHEVILHREGLPAYTASNGDSFYYLDGKLHRDDGPAVIYLNGDVKFYYKGNLHNDAGAAIVEQKRYKKDICDHLEYFYYGKLHNISGPAIINFDGSKEYYLFGRRFASEDDWMDELTKP